MAKTSYIVKRRHFGDKDYFEGDIREAAPAEVLHLVEQGVLEEAKAEAPVRNKAVKAPRNKAKS